MKEDVVKISRKELYNQVWSTPISKLAKQYGLSDVGFAKICKKYNIPRPPRGYWARLAAGQRPKRIELPSGNDEQSIEISANPITNTHRHSPAKKLKHPPVVVPKSLRNSHPLVKVAAEKLELCEPDRLGILEPPDKNCLDIRVSKNTFRRALRIMDAVIKALEGRGYRTYVNDGSTAVEIEGIELQFGISEDFRSERKPSRDFDTEGYYRFGHSKFDYVRVPSGQLCLTIHESGWYLRGSYRKNWRDTKKKQLENLLDSFMGGLEAISLRRKEHIREEEEKERERRERQRQREEKAKILAEKKRRIETEQSRVDNLISEAENWKISQIVREYVAAVKESVMNGNSTICPENELQNWAKWALDQADRLDPLEESPPSILDEIIDDDLDNDERPSPFRW